MRLLPTLELAAQQASPYTDQDLASSELILNGKPTGLIVNGAVLEAAVEWKGYRIAFFTDDIPFEDMLRIYMFDANMTMVDAATIGAMYSTGTFNELSLQPPNALTFRFFGYTIWRLVLLAQPEFSLPVISDPSGVSRRFKFFRLFRIEGKPQPERAGALSHHEDKATLAEAATPASSPDHPNASKFQLASIGASA